MKTAISIPNDVFNTANAFARHKHLSRSALFTIAMTEFLAHHRRDDVTEQLNRVYGEQASTLDPVVNEFQLVSLPKEKW